MVAKVKTEDKVRCKMGRPAGQRHWAVQRAEDHKLASKKSLGHFHNKLRTVPTFVRKFYDDKIKKGHMTNPEKAEFVQEVLSTRDFKSEFFERIQKFEVRDEETDIATSFSWKEVPCLDGEALVNAQHKARWCVVRRPHPKLDPTHETTVAMPENERVQYKQGRNQEIHTNAGLNETSRSSKDEPPEFDTLKPYDNEQEKKILSGVVKVHNGVLASAIDVTTKRGKFQDTKYFMRVFNNSQCIPNY
jgi:hypothetical protein